MAYDSYYHVPKAVLEALKGHISNAMLPEIPYVAGPDNLLIMTQSALKIAETSSQEALLIVLDIEREKYGATPKDNGAQETNTDTSELRNSLEEAIESICSMCKKINPQHKECISCQEIEDYKCVLEGSR